MIRHRRPIVILVLLFIVTAIIVVPLRLHPLEHSPLSSGTSSSLSAVLWFLWSWF